MSITLSEFTNNCGSYAVIRLEKGSILYQLIATDKNNVVVLKHTYNTYNAAYKAMQRFYNNTMIEKKGM